MADICPFCGFVAERAGNHCRGCGRDPTAPRRVCAACARMSPIGDPVCCHCGKAFGSEMAWKVPLIVLLFTAALVLGVLIQVFAH